MTAPLPLATTEYGAGAPLVIVHGLFGSARNWGAMARRLAAGRQVIAVDLRNHGLSPWATSHSYPDMAADLARVIEATGGPADILGHSMGGKAAMWLALTRPDLVRRLIVADIAPVAYAHSQTPLVDAMQRMDLAAIPDRREAEARLAASGVGDAATRAFLLQSLDLRTDPPAWRINLPVLSATMPQIIGWPGTEGTAPYPGPSLFLSGAQSTYVQPEHRPLIRTLFPRVQAARIPGAGHWLHADRPREFEAAVRAWLG